MKESLQHSEDNITPHFFRHFFNLYSPQQGLSIYDIQRTLDHESIRTTEIYLDKFMKNERTNKILCKNI
ncbi:tyrosine-type recombinase/integrase [Pseudalkalibacillus sp. A8]|uniref:tyrosine-type recombinase/integrase n=1 Tax=Pseudalkalibacillus sp. A8 TaxID=3382641 RepID=UPI0038B43DCE